MNCWSECSGKGSTAWALSLNNDPKMTEVFTVADSLDHFPERCTVVACYKRLVVGVAILSSPRETYITYLAVRAGWDNARIARYGVSTDRVKYVIDWRRSMLYHLIMLNPKKDITLHVSVNNSAMVHPLKRFRILV